MKIYFAGSIRGGREDQKLYLQIIAFLQEFGTVLTEHVGNAKLTEMGEQEPTDSFIFERDMDWLRSADLIIAEVTTPSLGVGYELGAADYLGKEVLCLYRPQLGKRLSAMIGGNKKFTVYEYSNLEEAKEKLKIYLK